MSGFRSFLLNESRYYLGHRAGDLLSAMQSLLDDGQQLGNRALIRAAEGLVTQIRRVLHSRWEEEEVKYLKTLQKVGVALSKAVEENADLAEVLPSAVQEMEAMLQQMEVPVNSMGVEDEPPATEDPGGELPADTGEGDDGGIPAEL